VPFGAIGEVALEGPGCADGYIGNSTLTERVFLKNPTFLSLGHGPDRPGRHGLIYLTGDLARYDTNGDLILLGRKDAQLKISGQLVAPEEVQYHIRRCLEYRDDIEVIVDGILPENGRNLTLVAFISPATLAELEKISNGLNEKLKATLPRYAIPSYYIPVPAIPTTPTGKRDRTRLREIGAAFTPPRQRPGSKRREPTTTAERTLRELWSLALRVDAENISANDSFLRTGDSIQAMRLVGIARQQGLSLTVSDIFQHPTLKDMAKLLKNQVDITEVEIPPFTLLIHDQGVELARQHAASLCGMSMDEIEDLFPCTQLQEGLLALTMKRQGDYTGRNILELAPSIDLVRFKNAWEKVVETIPILRTRIIDLPGQGLVQAVIRGRECWTEAEDVSDYLAKERELPMGLGSPLMRCGLFLNSAVDSVVSRQENLQKERSLASLEDKDHTSNAHGNQYAGHKAAVQSEGLSKAGNRQGFYFALTMHHSIYDGLTTHLILETLESLYKGATPLRYRAFQSFVNYIGSQGKEAEVRFWKAQFDGLEAAQFPGLPSSTYQPRTDSALTHSVEDIVWRGDNSTPSTVIRAAWGLVCSQYSNSSDVVFGTVVAGRKAPVGGIERLAGPTIATLPIRVKIDGEGNILKLVTALQSQATEMIPYEQTGLSKIRQISDEAQQACRFQTLVVVQPREQNIKDSSLFVSEANVEREGEGHRYHGFNSYALSLICILEENRLRVEFCFDSSVIEHQTIQRIAQHFEQILRKLCSGDLDETRICDISMTTDHDLDQIWKWNSETPESIERCVHDLITEVARNQPDAIAVSAWDGELTYGKLDRLSSCIAYRLTELRVKRNMIVPLCFEKSMFALVALLSVIKAGGAGLLLDPTLPESRLKAILHQVEPALVLSSASNEMLSSKLVVNTLVLGADSDIVRTSMSENVGEVEKELPYVDPSDLLYVIFTSGSTGIPKGCLMQHRNFSSAVSHQRTVLRLNKSSRMYDFSSYTFDATYWSAFHVLAAGGTLCIPSEDERKSNLTDSMRRLNTTDIFLTPSTARMIDATKIPTLRNVHLGGEEVTKDDVALWMPYANTFVSYGPAECSAGTLYWNVPSPMPPRLSIGKAVGASTWIVDQLSSERLSPVGTVGELYLEGPLVGKGYLCDEEKTASSFIEDPSWLLKGAPDGSIPGRGGRLYKTGDLVKYNPADGTLIFVGRKDSQVKLRGQRIELSEVEHHVRHFMGSRLEVPAAVAEVVVPNATGRPALVVFIQLEPTEKAKINELVKDLDFKLPERLPSYMVPGAYIPIKSVPQTVSGKIDRRRLRRIGANLTLQQLRGAVGRTNGKSPSTESELRLQKLWTTILGVPADKIRTDSSFLHFGDSISAMRLAALARNQGISLTVQTILKTPRLSEMIKGMTSLHSDASIHGDMVLPFSLLKDPKNEGTTLGYISRQCNTHTSHIEDVFPCTGVQKSLLSMTAKSDSSYIAKYLLRLREDVDVYRLKQAWEDVSKTSAPILRYRIVDIPTEGLVQVQLNESLEWDSCDSVATYLERVRSRSMGLSKPLTRLAVVGDTTAGERYCILTQHHAIYDGYSMDLLLKEVSKAYAGVVDNSPVAPFQAFIKYVVGVDQEEAREFWRREFSESEAIPFPALPDQDYQPKADSTVRRDVADFKWPNGDATASTIIRTAWSILTARYTDSEDVVFGAMITGRQAPLAGIDRIIAPLINAVPIRVKFDPKQSVDNLLSDVQKQSIAMIPYEQTELLDIRRINADCERGSRFNTLLIVQPAGQGSYMNHGDGPFLNQSEIKSTNNGLDDFK
jgi:amino acid adenylation domain-containing protein